MFRSWPPQAFAQEQEKRFSLLFPGLALPVVISYKHLDFFLRQSPNLSEQSTVSPLLHHLFSEQFLNTINAKMINTPQDSGKHSTEHNEYNLSTFLVICLATPVTTNLV